MIYFAQMETGAIKIGFSGNVNARLKELRFAYNQEVTLLDTIEGDRKAEHALHVRFGHLRLGETEFFRPTKELMEFIGKPLLVDVNPDAVEASPNRSQRFTFYPYEEDIAILEDARAELQALLPHKRVSMSDAIRHVLREF